MKFVKFPHIDDIYLIRDFETIDERINDYQCRRLNNDDNWIVTEKIDGCNVSFLISKDEIKMARRSAILKTNEKFYALNKYYPTVDPILKKIQSLLEDNQAITVFGEYYGNGIQNRVFYGKECYFKMFAILKFDGDEPVWTSYNEFKDFLLNKVFDGDIQQFEKWTVPVLAKTKTFQQALDFGNTFTSTLTDTEHNSVAEGTVIRPNYVSGYVNGNAELIFKNKNKIFKESRYIAEPSGEVLRINDLRKIFASDYCTENRMYSVFSKRGVPTDMALIKDYIKDFIDDALEDFVIDHPEYNALEEKDQKTVKNIKSLGFLLFKDVNNKITNS